MSNLTAAIKAARACRLCADELPLGPRPVFHLHAGVRLLLISQAPGTKVHETGLPFNDRSGDRLREWLGINRETFYGNRRFGIMAMGFCYPGVDASGGDKPPTKICAPTWHPRFLAQLPLVELKLLVGQYALQRYLGASRRDTLTATVRAWREFLPEFLPLPHPSWRNTAWLTHNKWFEREVVPELQRHVRRLLELKP